MTGNFIYVFDPDLKDDLVKQGYTLLYSDDNKCRYVFANEMYMTFSVDPSKAVITDQLTF